MSKVHLRYSNIRKAWYTDDNLDREYMKKCKSCGCFFLGISQKQHCGICVELRYEKLKYLRGNASAAVAAAIKNGIITKLDGSVTCVDCGAIATDYDHREYAKPLEVAAVCRSCNITRGPAKETRDTVVRLPHRFLAIESQSKESAQ